MYQRKLAIEWTEQSILLANNIAFCGDGLVDRAAG